MTEQLAVETPFFHVKAENIATDDPIQKTIRKK